MLKQRIRPEFLNRIDELIMFEPLKESEIEEIVRLQLNRVKEMLAASDITLNVTDEAVRLIAKDGYDPEFGARPVKRVIQRDVLNELSKQIIAEKVERDKPITIGEENGHVTFVNA